MSWRFHPLAEFPTNGILQCEVNGKVRIAEFLTPAQAKAIQRRKDRAA